MCGDDVVACDTTECKRGVEQSVDESWIAVPFFVFLEKRWRTWKLMEPAEDSRSRGQKPCSDLGSRGEKTGPVSDSVLSPVGIGIRKN